MTPYSSLLQDYRVFRTGSSASDFKALLRLEQKNLVWKMYNIQKVALSGRLVVDCFAGIFSAAKACIHSPQHKLFVGSDLDSECVALSLSQLALNFAREILNKELDNTVDQDVP